MSNHVCSNCGAAAYYDGRCGDDPVLTCNCRNGRWVDDGRGGYQTTRRGARTVDEESSNNDYSGFYDNDRR